MQGERTRCRARACAPTIVRLIFTAFYRLGHTGIASAFSPAIYGWVRDATGSYDLALYVAAAMFIGGALLPLALGRYPVFRDSAGK